MRLSHRGIARGVLTGFVAAQITACSAVSQQTPVAPAGTPLSFRLPAPILNRLMSEVNAHARPNVRFNANAKVGMWTKVIGYYNYVFGQNAAGNKTVTAIDLGANGCLDTIGIAVDHLTNLWVACASYKKIGGAVQEYRPGSATPSATYFDTLNCGSGCTFAASAYDVVVDSSGHVFGANSFSEQCRSSCQYNTDPVVWWNASSPSSQASAIKEPDIKSSAYVDVDPDGNLYIDGSGCIGTQCGVLVDEIANPTSASPTITNLVAPTSTAYDGLYVSNHGRVLNLIDSGSRMIYQYALPWMSGEAPFNALGPTHQNYFGSGYPWAGSFNKNDTRMAIGDIEGWLDVGKVRKNHWSVVTNYNLFGGVFDAAYVPSDK